jgi:hypothetical protein
LRGLDDQRLGLEVPGRDEGVVGCPAQTDGQPTQVVEALLRSRAGPDLRPGTQRQGRRRGATELTPEPTQHLGAVA